MGVHGHSHSSVRVLVIGAGGHARVCVEALDDDPDHVLVGAVSRDGASVTAFPVPMLGHDQDLASIRTVHDVIHAHVAIGDNVARQLVARRWLDAGGVLRSCVSRFAMVSRLAAVDDGAALLPGSVVNAAATIGAGAIVNTNASVDHDCRVGAFVHIAPGAALAGDVEVGERTLVGLGARLLPGVRVGADCVVGAGAVVRADVPDGVTVVGVPARPVR